MEALGFMIFCGYMLVEIRIDDSEDIVRQRVQRQRSGERSIERSQELFQGSIKWSAFLSFRNRVFVEFRESSSADNR